MREKDYLIYVFSPLGPDKGDAATMKRTAEFLTRANYGLVFGNFEMDMHDGEIRYKTFVPCGGEAPCADVIRRSIYVPAMMLDRYGDGLLKVLYSDIDPEKACSMCENDIRDGADDDTEESGSTNDSTADILSRLSAHFSSDTSDTEDE